MYSILDSFNDNEIKKYIIDLIYSEKPILKIYLLEEKYNSFYDDYYDEIYEVRVEHLEYIMDVFNSLGIIITKEKINHMSLNNLIEIFWNIYHLKELKNIYINKYISSYYINDKPKIAEKEADLIIDNFILNYIKNNIKSKKIIFKKYKVNNLNFYKLVKVNNFLVERTNNKNLYKVFNEYMLIKDNFDDESLITKENNLPTIKNFFDNFISSRKYDKDKTKYIQYSEINNLNKMMQTIFSHSDKNNKTEREKDIINEYFMKGTKEKHKVLNEIYDFFICFSYLEKK